ncbi:MAG: hypothetical protein RIG62_24850 [Cyclobacteriaceae bacterium]|jgi:hypothetical protein
MLKISYLFGLLFLCSACASLNKAVVSDYNKREGLQELHLSAGYDVYQLRIDLIRQQTTTSSGDNTSQTTPTPYHYLGLHLGNGLFYDANRNLTLNLDQLPELAHLKDFTITKKERGLWNQPEIYTKQAKSFYKEKAGLFSSRLEANLGDSTIVVNEGFLSSKKTIQISANGLQCKGGLASTTLEEHANYILLKEFLHKEEYRQQENKIYLDRDYLVEDQGNVIEITQTRGLMRSTYYFIKVDNSYYFFDQRYRGVKITIRDYEVLVEDNGRDQAVFLVENLD